MRHTRKTDLKLLYKFLHLFVNEKGLFETGLCLFAKRCWEIGHIDFHQRRRILQLVEINKPKTWAKHFPYYLPKYDYNARLDFIVSLITKYSTPKKRK